MSTTWRFPTYRAESAPMRPGADDFKSWPSRHGTRLEAYAPPVGPCAGRIKTHVNEATRKRSVQWRIGK